MATLNSANSAKVLQQHRNRPVANRTVVPVIPLPYVHKRRQQQTARAEARKASEAAPLVEAPVAHEVLPSPIQPSTPCVESCELGDAPNSVVSTPLVVNGSYQEPTIEKIEDDSKLTSSTQSSAASIEMSEDKAGEMEEVVAEITSMEREVISADESVIVLARTESESQSTASHSTYQMPPDFVPANNTAHNRDTESSKFPPQQTFNDAHNTHPSNGSVMLGGYSESNNSSPAPPQSATHQPQPPLKFTQVPHGSDRRVSQSNSGQSQPLSNGYSPMGPPLPPGYFPRQEVFANGPGAEFMRRPVLQFGPVEGYSSNGTPHESRRPYGPVTPHSFHGSQSSAHEQDGAPPYYYQGPTPVITNGSNGHLDEACLLHNKSSANQTRDHYPPPPVIRNLPPPDMLDGLLEYLPSQFADSTFADSTLELRYSDDRATPVRIPGHNVIFARSATLRDMILAARRDSEGLSSRTLLIESDDRFLCTSGFYMAMHRLYGNPLLNLGPVIPMGPPGPYQIPSASTSTERFDLALGYAAAGRLLKIDTVIGRGCEIAGLFMNWATIEKGFDFALDGGLEPQWIVQPWTPESSRATYGPAVDVILHHAFDFIGSHFPARFQLDASVPEAKFIPRLPKISEHRQGMYNPRLSHIKFGDHAVDDASLRIDLLSPQVILSRIFLNLPWELLRYFFESTRLNSTLGNVAACHQLLRSIVLEREKRRLKVYACHVSNAERHARYREWETVGWQESVEELCGDERWPRLTRAWVDFVNADN